MPRAMNMVAVDVPCVPSDTSDQTRGDSAWCETPREAVPWLEQLANPTALLTSGCDSSDCSYCHKVAQQRRLQGRKTVCWLRRKRSEQELSGLGLSGDDAAVPSSLPRTPSATSLVPGGDDSTPSSRQPSMWDHALLEPQAARPLVSAAVASRADTGVEGWQPWRDEPWMAEQCNPVPADLVEVLSFRPDSPAACHQEGGDIVCGMEFEEHGWLLATGGVAKQIRVYSLASCLGPDAGGSATHAPQPIRVHRTFSKLSSLAWNPDQPGVVTVGDYDGVVSQVDLESGHLVAEADEHNGRRVWSVSHSLLRPHVAASGSDDGQALLWAGPSLERVVAAVRPLGGAAVCGVHLSPYDDNVLALACADAKAYVYDLRRLDAPVATLFGHGRPVSYVRFVGRSQLVTASVDATLARWELSPATSCGEYSVEGAAPLTQRAQRTRRFAGHLNGKNFVGLSVRPQDGLVACGSESNQVCAYSVNWDQPLVSHDFSGGAGAAGFCSAVCWQPAEACPSGEPLLAAATSDGQMRVLALRQRCAEEQA